MFHHRSNLYSRQTFCDSPPLPISVKQNTVPETTSVVTKDNTVGYVIALITFGAAVGNMFLAGKLRSVMNARVTYKYKQQRQHQQHQQSSGNGNNNSKSSNSGSSNSGSAAHDKLRLQIPPLVCKALVRLGLPKRADVSKEEVARAYRALAMSYHPDRHVGVEDKEKYTQKFKVLQEDHDEIKLWQDGLPKNSHEQRK